MIKKAEHAGQVSARGPPINPDPEIELKVLYPFQKLIKRHPDKNDDSVVIQLKYQKAKFLFPGDASKKVEEQLVDKHNQELQNNVLKLGHHGARTASTEKFLNAVNSDTEYQQMTKIREEEDTVIPT